MCSKLQIHISNGLRGVFSSLTCNCRKQTQTNNRHSQKSGAMKCCDNEMKKLAYLYAERNERNLQKIFVRLCLH